MNRIYRFHFEEYDEFDEEYGYLDESRHSDQQSLSSIQIHIDSIATPQGKALIRAIDLIWEEGEIIALTGPSGAGKSVICKFITGILPKNLESSGFVTYLSDEGNRDLSAMTEKARTSWNAGRMVYLTQETDLAFNPLRKISKSFKDALSLAGRSSRREELSAWFESVELEKELLDRFPHELSGGQVQRALLAIALATGARWVIADEPTSNLDKLTQKKIIELLLKLHAKNKLGVLLVTHDIKLAKTLASKKIVVGTPAIPPPSLQPAILEKQEQLLSVSNLNFDYRKKGWGRRIPVLHNIELTVNAGEWVGVIGGSGGGKSTLAKLITRLMPMQNGAISFSGQPISALNRIAQSQVIQLVFQNPYTSLNPRLTVIDQLKDAIPGPETNEAPWSPLLASFGLSALDLNRLPGYYSGGERQRLAIVRVLLKKPKLLIADEAISSLDESNQYLTLHTLQEVTRQTNMAMLFISHDLTWMQQVCHRIYVLDQGKIIESGATKTIHSNPQHAITRTLLEAARGNFDPNR